MTKVSIQIATEGPEAAILLKRATDVLVDHCVCEKIDEAHFTSIDITTLFQANMIIYELSELCESCSDKTFFKYMSIKGSNISIVAKNIYHGIEGCEIF